MSSEPRFKPPLFVHSSEETIRETIERTFAKLATHGGQPEKMLKDRAHEFLDILEERSH